MSHRGKNHRTLQVECEARPYVHTRFFTFNVGKQKITFVVIGRR
jgi:hypothetical protein